MTKGVELQCFTAELSVGVSPVELLVHLQAQLETAKLQFFQRDGDPALIVISAAVHFRSIPDGLKVTANQNGAATILEGLSSEFREFVAARDKNSIYLSFPANDDASELVRSSSRSSLDVLRAVTFRLTKGCRDDPYSPCFLGMLGFDHIDMFERLPERGRSLFDSPDLEFCIPDAMVLVGPDGGVSIKILAFLGGDLEADTAQVERALQQRNKLMAVCAQAQQAVPRVSRQPSDAIVDPPALELSDEEFADLVRAVQEHVRSGDVYQIVPSRTFIADCKNALRAFAQLAVDDPSTYRFYLASSWGELFGASPEPAVRVIRDDGRRHVEVWPLAGTRPRGRTADHDSRLEAELSLDEKEAAEHMMLVDLARNDVARVSKPGTRIVAGLRKVLRFSRVMHLASSIEGELRPDLDAFDALRACATVGTLSGAPKLRAVELLRKYEASARGPYGGVVALIDAHGGLESAVIIRSAAVACGKAYVRAGAGVVLDSDPHAEAQETVHKASSVLRAIAAVA